MPEVSIIVPAYNSARFLRPTLTSALSQRGAETEVVVVDDGSSDGTAGIAREFAGVRVIERPNGGDAAARNTGLRETDSRFVLFLDHDDLLHPEAARAHLDAFNPGLDMVFGANDLIDSEGRVIGCNAQKPRAFSARQVVLGTTPSFSQCLYRRSALDRIGGFRDRVGSAADHDLNLRLLGFDPRGFCHGRMVMSYRLHAGQQTKSPARLFQAQMAVIEEHLGRGGALEDASLLRLARRHWARYYGQFIPSEILRAARAGRWDAAAASLGTYLSHAPGTMIGSARFLRRRLTRPGQPWPGAGPGPGPGPGAREA